MARYVAERIAARSLAASPPFVVDVGLNSAAQTVPDLLYAFERAGVRSARFAVVERSLTYLGIARLFVSRVLSTHPLRPSTAFDIHFVHADPFAPPGAPASVADSLSACGLGAADIVHVGDVLGPEDRQHATALRALSGAARPDAIVASGWVRADASLVQYSFWSAHDLTLAGPRASPFACRTFFDGMAVAPLSLSTALEQSLAVRLAPEKATRSPLWLEFVAANPSFAARVRDRMAGP